MTTDSGIDLVAYSPKKKKAYTIQIKSQEKHHLGGGKDKLSMGWSLNENCPADLIAVTDLSTDSAWLFTYREFAKRAQQHRPQGVYRLYMYVDETVKTKKKFALKSQFSHYLLEERMKVVLDYPFNRGIEKNY